MCASLCPSSTRRGFYDWLRGGAEGDSTTCRGFELSLGERHVSWHVCWHSGTGTQAGDLTALRVVVAFGVCELTNPYVRIEVFEDQDEGSHSIEGNANTNLDFLLPSKVFSN